MAKPSNALTLTDDLDPDGLDGAGSDVTLAFRDLDRAESAFITAYLGGGSADDSARHAGWTGRACGAKVLGRPAVKLAIQRVAPYLEPKRGARLVAPYILARLCEIALTGGDSQAIHASRDLLNLAGLGPVSRSESVTASLGDVLAALERRRDDRSAPIDVQSTVIAS
jgi:hypothetical protein